jgi:lipoprotein-anchoring transpeptidase ErfK/SrfK
VVVHTVLRAVDVGAAIGDVAAHNRFMVGVMMRIRTAAILLAFAGTFGLPAAGTRAQTAPQGMRPAQASQPVATEVSAQRRIRRPTTRLRVYPLYEWVPGVYPRYNPGPNAVRDCNATYVQEYRPSGTVIVPRMSCYWRPG